MQACACGVYALIARFDLKDDSTTQLLLFVRNKCKTRGKKTRLSKDVLHFLRWEPCLRDVLPPLPLPICINAHDSLLLKT